MDMERQIEYWRTSSWEDLEAGRSLLKSGHYRHALFLAHLALEKMLKARVIIHTRQLPPRIHNLERLAEISGLQLDLERKQALSSFGIYQLHGRYPDPAQPPVDKESAAKDLAIAEEMLKWLNAQS
jgi:HEPN domain-containing protein